MYQILTDSCCDIPFNILEEKNVDLISMEVLVNEVLYEDDLGKTFDLEKYYRELKSGVVPTTSQISAGRYIEIFTEYAKKNIPVLYICFSSGLSGSYNSSMLAANTVKEEYPNAQITVVDTLCASGGQGLLVLNACKKRDAGLSYEELGKWVEDSKMYYQHWVTVDDLNHLYLGGRVSRSSAAIGSVLQIKPIIYVSTVGKLDVVGKVRTRKKSLKYLADRVIEDFNEDYPDVIINTSGDIEGAEVVKNAILDDKPNAKIQIYPMGTTISAHTGFGCITAFFRGSKR